MYNYIPPDDEEADYLEYQKEVRELHYKNELDEIATDYRMSRNWFDVSRWDDEASMDCLVKIATIIDSSDSKENKLDDIADILSGLLYDTSMRHAQRCMDNKDTL